VTYEVIYVCMAEHADRIHLGLTKAGLECAVLAVADRSIALVTVDAASDVLGAPWSEGPLVLTGPPPRLVPFDQDTSTVDLYPYVKAQLVAELSNRVQEVTIRALAERTARYFPLFAAGAQQRLVANVRSAVRTIADQEPDTFAYEPGTSTRRDDLVRLLKTPEERDPRGRTQAYQALRDRSGRRRGPTVSEHQVDLLDLIADAGDTENDRPESEDDTRREDET
jgi:hypothetical protein